MVEHGQDITHCSPNDISQLSRRLLRPLRKLRLGGGTVLATWRPKHNNHFGIVLEDFLQPLFAFDVLDETAFEKSRLIYARTA